jgi:peptide/nickel transport system substrate-binding protein
MAACREDAATPTAQPDATPVAEAGGTPAASGDETATVGPTETPGPTAVPSVTPTATPVPTGPLTICLGTEPDSLYLYGPSSPAAGLIRELVYDGPIDTRGYDVQPVILEELPTLDNGGAVLQSVFVPEGQYVLDADGNVVRLRSGVTVRPAGCFDDSCAVTYERPEAPEAPPPTPTPEATAPPESTPPPAPRPTLPPNAGLEMDQLQATFVLLPGLTWSDGEPLTAADSVFSYELAQDAELPPRLRTGSQGLTPPRSLDPILRTASYTATDELTVIWSGIPGYFDPNYRSNFFIPLPAHRLEGLSSEELLQADDSARLPLGWGPYVLTEWSPGERIVAERNPNYFRVGEGLPYFDQVIFRLEALEPEAYLSELTGGECDVVVQNALGSDLEPYRALEGQGDAVVSAAPGPIWEHLDFGIDPVEGYTARGDVFQDARVRQAAAYCLNREGLAAAAGMGGTTIPDAYIPPQHPLYEQAALTQYPHDPQRGRALLAEAGWQDGNGDGVVEASGVPGVGNGAPLAATLLMPGQRPEVAAQIASDLAQCGFSITVAEPVDPALFFATSEESPVFGRRFDLASFAWLSDAQPACHLFLTREIPTAQTLWQGFNITGYQNEAYDAACLRALRAAPGMEMYDASHLEALRLFNAELPVVPLYQQLRAAVARPDIAGLELDPTAQSELWNVEFLSRQEE